jgi:hypothetical protein
MRNVTIAAVLAAGLGAGAAQAMPAANLAPASTALTHAAEVAWVCGPYRCWWQPNYYRYGYAPVVVRPRVVYAPYMYQQVYVRPTWYSYPYYYRRWWW